MAPQSNPAEPSGPNSSSSTPPRRQLQLAWLILSYSLHQWFPNLSVCWIQSSDADISSVWSSSGDSNEHTSREPLPSTTKHHWYVSRSGHGNAKYRINVIDHVGYRKLSCLKAGSTAGLVKYTEMQEVNNTSSQGFLSGLAWPCLEKLLVTTVGKEVLLTSSG